MPDTTAPAASLTCFRAVVLGTIGFTVVSVAGFSAWAVAGKWFYAHGGEAGLYAVCAVVFLGLSGLLLHPLVNGPRPVLRFYKIFVPAFLAYAVVWCGFWFALHFGVGEWLGSFLGCAVFALVLARAFGNYRALPLVIIVLFLTHAAGYFAGDYAMHHFPKPGGAWLGDLSKQNLGILAKLMWGVCYGAGFGAGLGHAFFAMQKRA